MPEIRIEFSPSSNEFTFDGGTTYTCRINNSQRGHKILARDIKSCVKESGHNFSLKQITNALEQFAVQCQNVSAVLPKNDLTTFKFNFVGEACQRH